MSKKLGISGSIANRFLRSEITPLLALVGLLLGIFATIITPREEEPQINVTFANIFIPFPGASSIEVEQLVAIPAEQVLSEVEGVKHIYSVSKPGMAVLTVRYKVGENRTEAIVRLYNAVYSNQDWLPTNLGVGQPIIKPKGIDDVPIVTFTLWSEDGRSISELSQVAHTIENELKRVKGTRNVFTIGSPDQVVHVLLDPQRLAGYNISIDNIRQSLLASNYTRDAGVVVTQNEEIPVKAGTFLVSADEVRSLVIAVYDQKPVYLSDVAEVKLKADDAENYVKFGTGISANTKGIDVNGEFPAVTIAIAKKPGTNAVKIANRLIERINQVKGIFIPQGVNITVTRNYGKTANDKAVKLISKLAFATAAVVFLVFFALGWREAIIVGTAVVITLAITLFASWAWGFTINRVSLFALIFSIGILVDDAIVVVENIHRHMQIGKKALLEAIPIAVDEVGGPTILATFTVIAALLPMAFVSGLMGPYMSPIPINASIGMLISLAVAFVVTPWLAYIVFAGKQHQQLDVEPESDTPYKIFNNIIGPFLHEEKGSGRRKMLLVGVLFLMLISISLVGFKLVVLKMLPFDNKSEFQVIVDMPEGTSVEQTVRVLAELGNYLSTINEVTDYQLYAGTASPINFNGLVRQYYLRNSANVGDIQVNLTDRSKRDRKSHEIAVAIRSDLQAIGNRFDANVKIVEVPPGPPVQAPIVAEVYGLDYQGQIAIGKKTREIFENTNEIVDVDDSVEKQSMRYIVKVDRNKAALLGLSQPAVSRAITTILQGEDVTYLHDANAKYPTAIRLEFPIAEKAHLESILSLKVRNNQSQLIPISEIAEVIKDKREHSIYHKDLLPLTYVTADSAGALDSPLYGMFDMSAQLETKAMNGIILDQYFLDQPDNPYQYAIKWDGEWQITYETFRDMGIAYAIGIILIYLLVVGQFRSYLVPLVIMAPIPLTIIGVMPGHALLGQQFTATSMIGMIALAGIIVRNSILLVDFINQQINEGVNFKEAVIRSGAVRAKPIILTGLAAMLGAFFILDDPIFSGLAISLIFGILVSTLLTLIVIPVMYYALMRNRFSS